MVQQTIGSVTMIDSIAALFEELILNNLHYYSCMDRYPHVDDTQGS